MHEPTVAIPVGSSCGAIRTVFNDPKTPVMCFLERTKFTSQTFFCSVVSQGNSMSDSIFFFATILFYFSVIADPVTKREEPKCPRCGK
jgi:hypothetical protein